MALRDDGGDGRQKRPGTFCGVQHAGIGRGVLGAEGITLSCRKQTEDFAVDAEVQRGDEYENDRVRSRLAERVKRDGTKEKCDGHRVLATDLIRQPAEERPADAVEYSIELNRKD